MARPLQEGDEVLCRLFDSVERKSYDDFFVAEITYIFTRGRTSLFPEEKMYDVVKLDGTEMTLHRNEIKRRVK
jgi:hypothetical protein